MGLHAVGGAGRAPVALLTLLAALLLAGCSLVSANLQIREILSKQGVEPENFTVETTNGETTLIVGYHTAASGPDGVADESRKVAETLWKEAPVGFDVLTMQPTGSADLDDISLDASELEREFGPRPEGAGGDMTGGLFRDLAVFAGIGLLLFIGLVVLIIALVVRARRKRRMANPLPGAWQPPPPPPGTPGW